MATVGLEDDAEWDQNRSNARQGNNYSALMTSYESDTREKARAARQASDVPQAVALAAEVPVAVRVVEEDERD